MLGSTPTPEPRNVAQVINDGPKQVVRTDDITTRFDVYFDAFEWDRQCGGRSCEHLYK